MCQNQLLGLVKNLIGSFDISENTTRVGIRKYGSGTESVTSLADYNQNVDQLAGNMNYVGGGTDAAAGLRTVVSHDFTPESGMRENSNKLLVMVTDGQSNDEIQTFYAARALHKSPGLGFEK